VKAIDKGDLTSPLVKAPRYAGLGLTNHKARELTIRGVESTSFLTIEIAFPITQRMGVLCSGEETRVVGAWMVFVV